MCMFTLNKIKPFLYIVLLTLGNAAYTLPEDRKEPVNIEADSAELSQATGQTVYKGNVKLNQGSLNINADEITISVKNGILDELVAKGNQANLSQLPKHNAPVIDATANTIYYNVGKDSLLLEGNASIAHGESSFNGNRIEYLINDERVTANERVRLTIPTVNSSNNADLK